MNNALTSKDGWAKGSLTEGEWEMSLYLVRGAITVADFLKFKILKAPIIWL